MTTTSVQTLNDVSTLPNLVIRASAGTGKTYHLSNRFLRLLFAGHQIDQILATTFTRKAAGEIQDRILFRLAEAAADETSCRALAEALGDESITRHACLTMLSRLTHNLHRLRVSTLDAFFVQVARTISLELGLPPAWQIVDESDELQLRTQAIQSLLQAEDTYAVVQLMHLLTKGEARRGIHSLVHETVADVHDIYRETDATAWRRLSRCPELNEQELADALEQLRDLDMSRNKSLAKAYSADLGRAVRGDWDQFIEKGIAAKILNDEMTYGRTEIPADAFPPYRRLLEHAGAMLRNRLALQTESTYELVDKFHEHFLAHKFHRRAMRFEDVTDALASATITSDVQRLTFRLDSKLECLLLDEFQDTSLGQWQVIRPLARRVSQDHTKRSFFCVGDVKQAIYGWRGGNSDILNAIDSQIANTTSEALHESHRSSQPITDVVNQINKRLSEHSDLDRSETAVADWCDNFPHHTTARGDLPGYVTLETAREADDSDEQTMATARHAVQRVREIRQHAPACSIAMLVRTNDLVGKLIFELQRRGISASEEGGNPLTDSACVQLILSLLSLADHPGDTAARFHVASSPLASVFSLHDHTDSDAAYQLAGTMRERLADEGFGRTLFDLSRELLSNCNRREWNRLQQLVEMAFDYQYKIEHPSQIGFGDQRRVSLRVDEFISHVQSHKVSDRSDDLVRVMTIHQAKGLQFDIVILPELDKDILGQSPRCVVGRQSPTAPIDRVSRYVNGHIQRLLPKAFQRMFKDYAYLQTRESLCLLYVALTRAIHALHIIIAPRKSTKDAPPRTLAGLLQASLNIPLPLPADELLFRHGNPTWYRSLTHAAGDSSEKATESVKTVSTVRLRPTDSGAPKRDLENTSPSSLEGGGVVHLSERLSKKNATGMQFGSLVHAFFEQIQWIEDGVPNNGRLRKIGQEMGIDDHLVQSALRDFRRAISNSKVAHVISRAFYGPAWLSEVRITKPTNEIVLQARNEQAIAVQHDRSLLSGFIDRLVIALDNGTPVAADVIDYKTDTIANDQELHRKIEHYQPQLDAYRLAVSRMLHLDQQHITARLVFLSIGHVHKFSRK